MLIYCLLNAMAPNGGQNKIAPLGFSHFQIVQNRRNKKGQYDTSQFQYQSFKLLDLTPVKYSVFFFDNNN